jgi:ABC-type spermidine/putrescine transport system permease subunit II
VNDFINQINQPVSSEIAYLAIVFVALSFLVFVFVYDKISKDKKKKDI